MVSFWANTYLWCEFHENRARGPYLTVTVSHILPLKELNGGEVVFLACTVMSLKDPRRSESDTLFAPCSNISLGLEHLPLEALFVRCPKSATAASVVSRSVSASIKLKADGLGIKNVLESGKKKNGGAWKVKR